MKKILISAVFAAMVAASAVSASDLKENDYILLVPKSEAVISFSEEKISPKYKDDNYEVLVYEAGEEVSLYIDTSYDVEIKGSKGESVDNYTVSYLGELIFNMPEDDVYLTMTEKPEAEPAVETPVEETSEETAAEPVDEPANEPAAVPVAVPVDEQAGAEDETAANDQQEIASVILPEETAEELPEAQPEGNSEETPDEATVEELPAEEAADENVEPETFPEYEAEPGTFLVKNETDNVKVTVSSDGNETVMTGNGEMNSKYFISSITAEAEDSDIYLAVYKNGLLLQNISEAISSSEAEEGKITADINEEIEGDKDGYAFVISAKKPSNPEDPDPVYETVEVNGQEVQIETMDITARTVADQGLNIRELPTANSKILGWYKNEEEAHITGQTVEEKPWYRVTFEKGGQTLTGYVRNLYVAVE